MPPLGISSSLAVAAATFFLLSTAAPIASAFLAVTPPPSRSTRLFGLSEWRDMVAEVFPGTGDDRRLGTEQGAPPRPVCILPFPFTDVLVQGETKQLRLYEDRFIQLFEEAMTNHSGVVAMGLMTDSGIIQTVPLCEVEAYNRDMEGSFGIFVTIRVVSRANLIGIQQQEPYLKAACVESADKLPPNLELPNIVASNVENYMILLSSMEHRLAKAKEERKDGSGGEPGEPEDEMDRRITIAKLEDRFYEVPGDDGEDDDMDVEPDRRKRFRKAYEVARDTDMQGYALSTGSNSYSDRTPQELSAISWAAFCTEPLPEIDATFRIQALDCEDLLDRLKLASQMLKAKKEQLKVKMEKAGLKFRGGFGIEDDGLDEEQGGSSSSQ